MDALQMDKILIPGIPRIIAKYVIEDPIREFHLQIDSKNGNVDIIEWLVNEFSIKAEDVKTCKRCSIQLAWRNGDYYREIEKFYLLVESDRPFACSLSHTCLWGNLKLAKWLVEKFNLDVKYDNGLALRSACEYGHFDIVKWLINEFYPSYEDIIGTALCNACERGHLEICKWLNDRFKSIEFTEGMKNSIKYTFNLACVHRYFESIKWLIDNFDFITNDKFYHSFGYACEYGNLEIAQYLFEKFKYPSEDVRKFDNYILWTAYKHGHYKIVRWLMNTFDLKLNMLNPSVLKMILFLKLYAKV